MLSLVIHAVLGVATIAFVAWHNRRLFTGSWDGRRVQPLEATFYVVGVASVVLGWYCNIRYVDEFVRFADENTVLLASVDEAEAALHPVARLNRRRMLANLEALRAGADLHGRPLRVVEVPLPRVAERPVVLSADVSNVDTVLVAGQVKKRDGKLLADVDKARADVEASRDYLLAATAEKRQ